MIPPPACPPPKGGGISFEMKERAKRHQCRARFKRVVGMIPPPPFSRASLRALTYETREFLSEIKERLKSALLMQVVG